MPLSMHQVSAPIFVRGLGVLSTLLVKANVHATEHGLDPKTVIEARLAPDMLTLAGQVQRASDTSKLSVERLSGVPSPKFADDETSFADLQDRIAGTVAYLEKVSAAQLAGSEDKEIKLNVGPFQQTFSGSAYLLSFALPNFFFHITTAHDILRHLGVKVGKLDYLGPYD
jgi:hypothetical protein